MRPNIESIIAVVLTLFLFLVPLIAQADLVTCGGPPPDQPCRLTDLVFVLIRVINFLLGMSWILAIFFIFWGGWNMVVAWGNEEKIKEGRAIFRDAVIGFFLILISFLLINFVVLAFTGRSFQDNLRFLLP